MIRKLLVAIALMLFSAFFNGFEAYACEPCLKEKSMQFEETARAADLILIVQRNDFSPDELTHGIAGPETIKVKVLQKLKGEVSNAEITLKSWSGMCAYGIVLNDNLEHVVFLKKSGNLYHTVAICSVKSYAVKDGMVQFDTEKIAVEDFRVKLEKLGARKRD